MIRRQEHFNLVGRNTFRMDVGCACWVEYDSLEDLAELDLAALPQPVLHVGAGRGRGVRRFLRLGLRQ